MYDRTDERGVPISSGIPPLVIFAAIAGVIVILGMITLIFSNSAFGHAWPDTKAVEIPLS